MKINYIGLVASIYFAIMILSCKQDDLAPNLSSISIVNATIGLNAVKINTAGKSVDYNTHTTTINYGSSFSQSVLSSILDISAVASSDPSLNLISFSQELKPGGMYSLYLIGQNPNVEKIFVEEDNFPTFKTEELALRVINLAQDSGPLNVTLVSTPSINEFNKIAYKQASEFKTYAAPFSLLPNTLAFQVRDTNGTLLTTYTFTSANLVGTRYDSATLVIRGLIGGTGTNALGVTFVPNY